MFVVSLNWICEILNKNISLDDVMNAFNIQGFEVKGIDKKENDYLITIEVKANRPDMLSHYGVAREISSFMNIKLIEPRSDLNLKCEDNKKIDVQIDENICDCFNIIRIDDIDNTVSTPEYIRKRLELLWINSINAVVDISNYIAVELGQPTHSYDCDKISGNLLSVCNNEKKQKFTTLAGVDIDLEKDDILICDKEKALCVAGIIGSSNSEVDKNSKSILIESAVFSKVPVRVSSRRLKISSLASFRFERGVDPLTSFEFAKIFAQRVIEICGGKVTYYSSYKSKKVSGDIIDLRVNRVNALLGTSLSKEKIFSLLEKYNFITENKGNDLLVHVPSFRLDVKSEIDLIEEVARSVGYDNIESRNMNVISNYRPNKIYERFDVFRNILNGFGFNEVINYSFIPDEMQGILNVDKKDCVFLQNPLSNAYALMRPNLIYSLLYSSSYNYSVGNCNLALYEIGRVYKRDESSMTLSIEENSVSMIILGDRIPSGFGVNKGIKFDFYDMTSYLKNIFSHFNMNYDFEKFECDYLINSYNIVSDGMNLGFVGEICKDKFVKVLPNLKLIKDNIFYCEINIDKIKENNKYQTFESKFPSVTRMYNLVCNKDISVKDIMTLIKKCGKEIYSIKVNDIYKDGMNLNEQAILFEVCFWLSDRTLRADEVESIEDKILSNLNSSYGIRIK